MPPTKVVSQVFRAGTVTTMEHSATLVTSVTGGVLRRTLLTVPGTATWVTSMAVSTGASALRILGSLSVASGINLFDSFDNLIIFTLSEVTTESKGDYFREAVDLEQYELVLRNHKTL